MAKTLIFTVTTDLSYDQRMIRICTSLATAGYRVKLVGRKLPASVALSPQPFAQKRLFCVFKKGKLFYAEYNLRLFILLLFTRADCLCAIDLDTILPVYVVSVLKGTKRVYDAHELFCEMQEIATRPPVYRIWKKIERFAVPRFTAGYTVNQPIADEFREMYGVNYKVIRNISLLRDFESVQADEKYILYQGAVNEGRCFETLIPAFKEVDCKLVICGDGNFMNKAKQLVANCQLEGKVVFKGMVLPAELATITRKAYLGVTLFEETGLSNYYSLANRFFDYLHAGIPQLCVDYPAYREINEKCPVAVLISDTGISSVAKQLNNLLHNTVLYKELQHNCLLVRQEFNWQQEEKKLITFYNELFG